MFVLVTNCLCAYSNVILMSICCLYTPKQPSRGRTNSLPLESKQHFIYRDISSCGPRRIWTTCAFAVSKNDRNANIFLLSNKFSTRITIRIPVNQMARSYHLKLLIKSVISWVIYCHRINIETQSKEGYMSILRAWPHQKTNYLVRILVRLAL